MSGIVTKRDVICGLIGLGVVASVGCGSSASPASPSTPVATTPVALPVYAPPPAGVSVDHWKAMFYPDLKLRRVADGKTIHLDVSALPQNARDAVQAQAVMATTIMTETNPQTGVTTVLQRVDTVPVQDGVNFVVTYAADAPVSCVGGTAVPIDVGACTQPTVNNTGEVTGGVTKFTHLNIILYNPTDVLHEIFRTMGIVQSAPKPSIMATTGALAPTDEDILMLRGRYHYPLLAYFTEK